MRLLSRDTPLRPAPEPLEVDPRPVLLTGIVLWGVLLVLALLCRARLDEQGRGWWVWTPVVGIALGLGGLLYVRTWLRRRRPRP